MRALLSQMIPLAGPPASRGDLSERVRPGRRLLIFPVSQAFPVLLTGFAEGNFCILCQTPFLLLLIPTQRGLTSPHRAVNSLLFLVLLRRASLMSVFLRRYSM